MASQVYYEPNIIFKWSHYGLWNVKSVLRFTINNPTPPRVVSTSFVDNEYQNLCYIQYLNRQGHCQQHQFKVHNEVRALDNNQYEILVYLVQVDNTATPKQVRI
eukprot:UN05109